MTVSPTAQVQRAFWTLSVTRRDCEGFNKLSNPWDGALVQTSKSGHQPLVATR